MHRRSPGPWASATRERLSAIPLDVASSTNSRGEMPIGCRLRQSWSASRKLSEGAGTGPGWNQGRPLLGAEGDERRQKRRDTALRCFGDDSVAPVAAHELKIH